jgi:imidazolonepropionase-like amidohydrolase
VTSSPLHVRGVVLPDDEVRDLWLVGDRVTLSPVAGADTIAATGFIVPGLVDAHCHIGIAEGGVAVESVAQAKELALLDRDAGVLALRDAGSPIDYRALDDDPEVPRLVRAGRHVAPPKRYLRGLGIEVGEAEVADELVRQASRGTGWVKLVGDWLDRDRADLAPGWDPAVMAAGVRAAQAAGARVAVHTFGEEAVSALIRAGVDSVEHGTGIDDEDIAEMARRGTAFVPTMINILTFGSIADQAQGKFPGYARHMRALGDGFPMKVRHAYEAGVPIYVGSDAGGGIQHGLAAREMLLLHESAGMAPLDVLAAGSWAAREWLGLPGLVEGGRADLIVYDADPRTDLSTVLSPRRIVLKGRVVR